MKATEGGRGLSTIWIAWINHKTDAVRPIRFTSCLLELMSKEVEMDLNFDFAEHQNKLVRKLYKNVLNTMEIRKLIFAAKLPFTMISPELVSNTC